MRTGTANRKGQSTGNSKMIAALEMKAASEFFPDNTNDCALMTNLDPCAILLIVIYSR